jgi:23S rRNA pseudouridine1911/1915/1917 synthase
VSRPVSSEFTVGPEQGGATLAGLLRQAAPALSWGQCRALCTSGKVSVDGQTVLEPATRLQPGQRVSLRMTAPRPRDPRGAVPIVHEDASVVVILKPVGVSSVPYERRDTGTAMDLLRETWRRHGEAATSRALHVVHRIDKDTSGLLVFAMSKRAERGLAAQFRAHTVERTYLCVAHGRVRDARIESQLVADRGDGLRGSTRRPGQGKRAVTHVRALRVITTARGQEATLCEVRLETGKTHQIRIHLAERNHPLVGERVYIRDFRNLGNEEFPSPRLLLHAATLGFRHPVTGAALHFEAPLPEDFQAALAGLK